jgi:hypothetical protein
MGIDQIMACAAIDLERWPDWDAAAGYIARLAPDDLDAEVREGVWGYLDDEWRERFEEVRAGLAEDLAEFRLHVDSDYTRLLSRSFVVRGARIYATGGPSVGESPSILYGPMERLIAARVLGAAGFEACSA